MIQLWRKLEFIHLPIYIYKEIPLVQNKIPSKFGNKRMIVSSSILSFELILSSSFIWFTFIIKFFFKSHHIWSIELTVCVYMYFAMLIYTQ